MVYVALSCLLVIITQLAYQLSPVFSVTVSYHQKLIFQIVIAVILAVYQSKVSSFGTSIYVPVVKEYIDLGWFYIPFVAFVLVAMVNAVNLADGLDGLAGGCTAITALFLAITGAGIGYTSSSIFSAAIAGACFGFLLFNRYPAKVFMGDTGSLALGGALAAAAVMMNIELILRSREVFSWRRWFPISFRWSASRRGANGFFAWRRFIITSSWAAGKRQKS